MNNHARMTRFEFDCRCVFSPTWRSPLYLLSGFTFACLVLGFFAIDEDEPSSEEDMRVDWIGAILITCGLILIVFVLSDTPTAREGWRNPRESSVFLYWYVPHVCDTQISLAFSSPASSLSYCLFCGNTTWNEGLKIPISHVRAGRRRHS